MERPDLTEVPPLIVQYISYLEEELSRIGAKQNDEPTKVFHEPPSTINVITASNKGLVKRTPRHFYSRQKRGGMGVFDLDSPEGDAPDFVVVGDQEEEAVVISNFARVFRLPIATIQEAEVRAKGHPIRDLMAFHEKEYVAGVLTGSDNYVAILTEKAFVITRNRHYLKNGAILYDVHQTGAPVAVCWSNGQDHLFVSTQQGKAIRFGVKQVPNRGCLAIRRESGDELLSITAVSEDEGVLLVGADGKGTIRRMSGFRANKAPGAGGKTAMNCETLVGAMKVGEADDVFMISKLGKMIRFSAADIPAKEGVVQGVVCMQLRADEVAAVAVSEMSD
ncbi:MAG: DNA gyrase C-terminal beta-propeller domain-containing protein [Ardenticatenaceae bacterium]|nr:DNA gyrase C-terminal beta-propeller domain-containing protein [Ardenticatenaceae bacterium]